MLVQFSETENAEITNKSLNQNEINPSLQDLFWFCECLHLDTGHKLCIGKCGYENCKCAQFIPKEFCIKLEITKSDVFLFENSDLIYDSPTFWLEFENWSKINDKT